MPRFRRTALPLLALILTGCLETRSYDLRIVNQLPTPVTACLTKTDGPREPAWTSPEQQALPPTPAASDTPPGIVIPPGRAAVKTGVAGRFDPRYGRAFLRIYEGTPGLNEMTAISPGSNRRVDVLLVPGENQLVVQADKTGQMTVVRTVPGPTAAVSPTAR